MNSLLTITDMAMQLERRQTSSEKETEKILAQVTQHNPHWTIFASAFSERAMLAATQSDQRRAKNQTLSVLDGIPVAVKDNIYVQQYPVLAGTGHDFSPRFEHSASVVQRLEQAGAIVVGSCNMDEAALGATTNNPHVGQCVNPAKPGCTPGGSSGGSAAAVAAGWAAASLGTDTLGSVRIPAAYCHLWGIKPTHGLVPTNGLVPLCADLDSIGPLAHNVHELKLMLSLLTDGQGAAIQPAALKRSLKIAIAPESLLLSCENMVATAFDAFLTRIADQGMQFSSEGFDFWNPGQLRRHAFVLTEVRAAHALAHELEENPLAFSGTFHAMMQYGRSISTERLYTSVKRIETARKHTLALFDSCDYLLLPTAPQLAFPVENSAPDNQADFTTLASISGCPSVAFPIPVAKTDNTSGNAFASAQLLGKPGSDFELLSVAEQLTAD